MIWNYLAPICLKGSWEIFFFELKEIDKEKDKTLMDQQLTIILMIVRIADCIETKITLKIW